MDNQGAPDHSIPREVTPAVCTKPHRFRNSGFALRILLRIFVYGVGAEKKTKDGIAMPDTGRQKLR